MKKLMIGSLAAVVLLGGCTTMDPYTQQSKTSQATKGAAGCSGWCRSGSGGCRQG